MAELSGFEVLGLVKEIDSTLQGTYVNNIYSLGEAQIFRFRKTEGEDLWLIVSPTKGVWISDRVRERAVTNEFTTKLRRELVRAKFVSASQVDLDRVFVVELAEGEGTKKLVVELRPPGNIIVTDVDGKILLIKNEVRSTRRRVMLGDTYAPPSQARLEPQLVRAEDVRMMADKEKTAGAAIGKHVSIPKKYVLEVLGRLQLAEDVPSSSLIGIEEKVAATLRGLVSEVRNNPFPCLSTLPGGDEIFALRPLSFQVSVEAPSLSVLCDRILLDDVVKAAVTPIDRDESKAKELQVTLSRLKAQEKDMLMESSKLRKAASEASGAQSIPVALKILEQAGLKSRKQLASEAAVASVLYDKAKELEAKAAEARKAAERLARNSHPKKFKASGDTKLLPRRREEWYEKFRWFFTSGGRLAIGGRDAHSNSILIRRHTEEADTVYHADLFGSPFFVLKGGKEQSEAEFREVAQATVSFSSAWKTGLGTADAYWVSPGQLSSAAPSGEYLAKGSFAIKGKKNYVPKNFVELAIGIGEEGGVIAGPETAISRNAKRYVVIVPHREKGSDTAKRVLKEIGITSEDGARSEVTLDDVLRALPAGGGKIVRRSRNAFSSLK